jgi:ribonucleoside-diphosphate reductase alpha chain
MAIEEWSRDRTGVQQELLADSTPRQAIGGGAPAREKVTTRAPEASAEPVQAQMSFEAYGSGEAFMGTCPDCGSQLEYAEGCVKCHVCGFSECG